MSVHSSYLLELVLVVRNEVVLTVFDLLDRPGDDACCPRIDVGGLEDLVQL